MDTRLVHLFLSPLMTASKHRQELFREAQRHFPQMCVAHLVLLQMQLLQEPIRIFRMHSPLEIVTNISTLFPTTLVIQQHTLLPTSSKLIPRLLPAEHFRTSTATALTTPESRALPCRPQPMLRQVSIPLLQNCNEQARRSPAEYAVHTALSVI